MKNEIALKVYEIDYDFIIKNYLNPELWKKEWTLFIYRDFIFTLSLYEINVSDNKIYFSLKLKNGYETSTRFIYYYIDNETYKILKKQINGAMFYLIEDMEDKKLKLTEEYQQIEDGRDLEYDTLKDIADNFLDENGVSNREIRDVYIDYYIDNNSRIDDLKSQFIKSKKYTLLTDLFLILTKITNDVVRYEDVLDRVRDNKENVKDIIEQLKEYVEKLENQDQDLIDELTDDLEAL